MATQKTLTISGKTFTGKQIAAKFDKSSMTNGGDYIVNLNGEHYTANYRQMQDYFAPVCSAANANAIKLESRSEIGSAIWIAL